MPWAIRRSLSPNTAEGIETLRSTLLTKDNRVQWETLLDLVAQATAADAAAEPELPPDELPPESARILRCSGSTVRKTSKLESCS